MSGTGRLVIVGAGPAGLAAARGYRDAGGAGEVVLLNDQPHRPYQRPALSKELLRGEAEPPDIELESPDFYGQHGIDVRLTAPAQALDVPGRTVRAAGVGALAWDTCVLATGGRPQPLPVPGADHPDVRYLRSLDQALALRERAARATHAIVVGAGFIGCEAAASLALRGLRVTLVAQEDVPHAPRLGVDAGERIAAWLEEAGVALVLGAEVDAIEDGATVRAGERSVRGDLVLVGGGMEPVTELAEGAGVALRDGRVAVDEHMRTSTPGVLAAGDLVSAHNGAAGRPLAVEHWGEALAMGEVAGRVAAGDGDAAWAQAPGFWSTIGTHTLKHAAWGDGFETARLVDHGGGAFTVWYGDAAGTTVGVLTHERDEDYERGRALVEAGAPLP